MLARDLPKPRGHVFKQRRRPAALARLIYLVATPGHPNFGDEVIVRRWLETLAKVEPGSQVWVDCPNPGPAAALLKDAHPDVHFTDTVFRLCWDAPGDSVREVDNFVTRALDDPGEAPRWIPGIDLLRTADVFHVVGGGYVNTIWPRHTGIVAVARWMSRATDARIAATGLGLMPADDGADELWREAAPSFDVLTVRDTESHELFDGAPQARLAPDDVFLGGLGPLYARDAAGAPGFMLCVQDDLNPSDDFTPVVETVSSTLRAWGAQGQAIGVVECIPRVDRRIYDRLLPEFPDLRFYSLWEVLRDGFPAAAHQRWISSRFHPHILAAGAGASGVTLSIREDYYDVKHAAVRRMGSAWETVSAGQTAGEAGSAGSLPERADKHSEAVQRIGREIYG